MARLSKNSRPNGHALKWRPPFSEPLGLESGRHRRTLGADTRATTRDIACCACFRGTAFCARALSACTLAIVSPKPNNQLIQTTRTSERNAVMRPIEGGANSGGRRRSAWGSSRDHSAQDKGQRREWPRQDPCCRPKASDAPPTVGERRLPKRGRTATDHREPILRRPLLGPPRTAMRSAENSALAKAHKRSAPQVLRPTRAAS